jgi:hypothetical protein
MKGLLAICIPLSLLTGSAMSQTSTTGSDQKSPIVSTVGSGGATLSLSNGRGKISIKCADSDSTRECVQAVLPVLTFGQGAGGVIYATTSIKCGSTVYQVSTGTSSGNCAVAGPKGGPANNANCADGGNTASATCEEGCGATGGSGSCTIKQ